jgi:magnesium-transporting ATPase (P-type)
MPRRCLPLLRLAPALHRWLQVQCEKPSANLPQFIGNISLAGGAQKNMFALDSDQLLLRGSLVRNTKWIIGVCIYTGPETKIMMNSKPAKKKTSRIEIMVNTLIYSIFGLLFAIVLATAVVSVLFVRQFQDKMWYLPDKSEKVRSLTPEVSTMYFPSGLLRPYRSV